MDGSQADEPTVDWSVDARTVQHLHRQLELMTALSSVRGDVALLAGLDPRWSRVQGALERESDNDEALEQLLAGPLGKLVLGELRKRVDEEHAVPPASLRAAPSPGRDEEPRTEESPEPLAHPVRSRRSAGLVALGAAVFLLAVAAGYGIGALQAPSLDRTELHAAQPPRSVAIPGAPTR